MAESDTSIWTVNRGDKLRIQSPDIGDVTVLVSEPRKETTLPDGRAHAVFVLSDGQMAGINFPPETDIERSILVEDEDRYQHIIGRTVDGKELILTRREPGQPEDWEERDGFDVVMWEREQ